MTSRNPVLWREGLFVKPQHFQQMAHSAQASIQQQIHSLTDAFYGFSELELNSEYLGFGKIAISRARGIMPDGTVFDIPGDMSPPPPLEIADNAAGEVVYLCLPLRTASALEVRWPESDTNARYVAQATLVKDTHSPDGNAESVDLAVANLQLKRHSDDRSAYTVLAVARLLDKGSNANLLLDEHFYPTSVSLQVVKPLKRFLEEVTGMMAERARTIAKRVCSPGQSGVADITDFNLLQLLNRLHPHFRHLANQRNIHPERLYLALSQACGELATFTELSRQSEPHPPYQHDHPSESFHPLEAMLRRALGTVLEPRAINLEIKHQQFGIYTALMADSRLLQDADFILAVSARMPGEELRQRFLQQAKVVSIENLSERVRLNLPGIPLTPLPVAPRHLPFHAGFTYFELNSRDSSWNSLKGSSGFGFHVAGNFPDLLMQFWAIRKEV